ncbi:hypothetical protein BS47DRAFT_1392947 [Hydnum rufescens UP504]|uniref:Uncharacterized protein n=1 Tax=Hydnum rufescens UP504 TaxID=1448309 RepID=A0A9P6AY82_9AGAM|nr:hypothetical protein BS47DRAFT_1392947 [Hydnum rufescens UP504]
MNGPRHSLSVLSDDDAQYDQSSHLDPTSSMTALANKTWGLFDRILGRSPTDRSPHRGNLSLNVPILGPTTSKNDTASADKSQSYSPHSQSPHSEDSGPPSPSLGPPLTINTLSHSERAEKVKRRRKVLQILGDIPFVTSDTGDVAFDMAISRPSNPGMVTPPYHIRRHSSPISPNLAKEVVLGPRVLRRAAAAAAHRPVAPTSSPSSDSEDFVVVPNARPSFSVETPHAVPHPRMTPPRPTNSIDRKTSFASISTTDSASTILSITDHQNSKTKAELERARKRATLAKLHQFLGSHIPPELVLGAYSPPKQRVPSSIPAPSSVLPEIQTLPVAYVSDGDLDSRTSRLTPAQHAHIVRKKQKITKMLGVCPPNALMEQSGFIEPPHSSRLTSSPLYMQHRYSINSLAYLVKKNKQEQLQDLLTYIRTDGDGRGRSRGSGVRAQSSFSDEDENVDVRRNSNSTSSISSSRMEYQEAPPSPTRSSISSFSAVMSPPPQPNEFQRRRKRAAKLSSFFGVEYRELFTEVLNTIESEVRSDRARGSLTAAEVQELLAKLRKLKAA